MASEIPARWLGLYSGTNSDGFVKPEQDGNPPAEVSIKGPGSTWEFVGWTEEQGRRIATYREQQ